MPLAQLADDVLDLLDLVLGALAGVDVGDVDDGLLGRVEHLQDVVDIRAAIEEVADVEALEVLVAVELLVVGVGDGVELGLVLRSQYRLGVAAEVRPGHGDNMGAVAGYELAEMRAQLVVGVGGDVVEFVDGNQPVVESLDAVLIDGEAKRRVRADQHLVITRQEYPDGLDLPAIVTAWRVAEVPLRVDAPICPEAELRERLVHEGAAD